MADPIQQQIAQMQAQVLEQASPGAALSEAERLAGSAGPYQGVGQQYLQSGRALNTLASMGRPTSPTAVTSGGAQSASSQINSGIARLQQPFTPELVAGYVDASGIYHPSSYTRPNPGQPMAPSSADFTGPSGTFDPGLISNDPRYQLLERRREELDKQRAQTEIDISQGYDVGVRGKLDEQAREVGASNMQLARMGALGTTLSGLAYQQNQARAHAREVADLEIKKQAAIQDARRAYENLDYDTALKQIEIGNQVESTFYERRQQQIDNLVKYAQIRQYERQAAKDEREYARETIANLAGAGISVDALPTDYLDYLDDVQGMPRGVSRKTFEIASEAAASAAEIAALDKELKIADVESKRADIERKIKEISFMEADKLIDWRSKVPAGMPIKIGDYTYTGWNTDGLEQGIQVDERGNGFGYTYNPVNNEWSVRPLGHIGAAKDGFELVETNQGWMNYNKNTGALIPVDSTVSDEQVNAILPEGLIWGDSPNFDADPIARRNPGECGALVNDLIGLGVGDSWKSKQEKTDPTIGTPKNPIQQWDAVVFKMGSTGHIGLINSMKPHPTDPSKLLFRITESNIKGDGRLTNTRWVPSDDPSITGFARGNPVPMIARIGTDGGGMPGVSRSSSTSSPLRVITSEERAANRKLTEALDKPVSDDVARELRLPVGTTYGEIKALGLILPQKDPNAKYTYMTDQNTGSVYAIKEGTTEAEQVIVRTPENKTLNITANAMEDTPETTSVVATTTREPLRILSDKEKPLSTSEIKGYGLDTTDPRNVGLTLSQVKARLAEEGEAREKALRGALPEQGIWEQKVSEALKNFNPRNDQVRQRVIDNSLAIRSEIEGGLPLLGDAAFNLLADASAENRASVERKIKNDLNKGNIKSAAESIKRVALERAEGESRKAEDGRAMSIRNFLELANVLDQYKKAGGKMNIIEGSTEDLAKRIGTVRNKQQRILANRFQQLLIDYRRAYTGATFTPQESAQYEALLPQGTDDFELSEAKITGLLQQMAAGSESFYRNRLGDDLYDNLYRNIRVVDVKTRKEGMIPLYEFDPALYIPLGK